MDTDTLSRIIDPVLDSDVTILDSSLVETVDVASTVNHISESIDTFLFIFSICLGILFAYAICKIVKDVVSGAM